MLRIEHGRENLKTPIGKVARVVRGRERWEGDAEIVGRWRKKHQREDFGSGVRSSRAV